MRLCRPFSSGLPEQVGLTRQSLSVRRVADYGQPARRESSCAEDRRNKLTTTKVHRKSDLRVRLASRPFWE